MAALHRAIGEWNRRRGTPGGTVGVLAPVDLRPDDWDEGDDRQLLGHDARVDEPPRARAAARRR